MNPTKGRAKTKQNSCFKRKDAGQDDSPGTGMLDVDGEVALRPPTRSPSSPCARERQINISKDKIEAHNHIDGQTDRQRKRISQPARQNRTEQNRTEQNIMHTGRRCTNK